jgi:hypothetical protein
VEKVEILTMNPEDLQKQIDKRSPDFAQPLNECDCRDEDSFYTKELLRDAVVVQLPKSGERPIPRKPPSFT